MSELNNRQQKIYKFIRDNGPVGNKQIREFLDSAMENIARMTVIRDLDRLIKNKFILKKGKGRNVIYKSTARGVMESFVSPEVYFQQHFEDRKLIKEMFNFGVFEFLSNKLISQNELERLDKLNEEKYVNKITDISPGILKRETGRLLVDFSWKSSQIEGNTYSILETETLVMEKIKAKGHSEEEAQMILGHQKALEYILNDKKEFQKATVAKIENVHSLLVGGLKISKSIRQGLVGIGGTKYRPLDNEYQIKEALSKVCEFINNEKIHPLIRAMMSVLLISYIQPFEDGNKRTARLVGNAILLAHNYCPLSYREVEVTEYKKATLLFYEQNNISYFKKIFIEQFEFAVNEYFL